MMTTPRSVAYSLLAWSTLGLTARDALGHPSSGIVVNANGEVFFQDAVGRSIWKIDTQGKLTKYYDKLGGHWMALDAEGRFSRSKLPFFQRITPDGERPALVVADGGSPIAVCRDGNLYYLCGFSRTEPMDAGGPLIGRMTPEGKLTVLAPGLKETVEKLDGITGLAAGPDGQLYAAFPSAVLKIGLDGKASTLVHPVVVADCDVDFPDGNPNFPLPALRGLAVDSDGTVYAAAVGCHRVVRITRDGKVEVVLKAERPWSPTGVALHGGDVYVLEYTNANGGPADGWTPRVRKRARDGEVTTLATVPPLPPLLVPGPSSPVKVGQGSGRILLADINRDGHLDLVTVHLLGSSVALLSGDGGGHFAWFDGAPLRLGYQPGAAAIGDVNNDGIPDLGIASRDAGSEYVHVLLGDGRGGFKPVPGSPFTVSSTVKTYKPSLRFIDVNEDRNLDIVAANGRRNTVEILFGDGQGGFSSPSVIALEPGHNNYTFALGDVDGDGHLDLLFEGDDTGVEPGRMRTLRGDGKGGFPGDLGPRSPVPSGFHVKALADVNGDRRPDVVFNRRTELGVWLNQGDGRFTPAARSPWPLGAEAFAVVVADLNRDRHADLVAATVDHTKPFRSRVVLLLGDGRSFTLAPGLPFPVGLGAYNVAVGDVNEDGKPDVATSSFEGDGVTILLGR